MEWHELRYEDLFRALGDAGVRYLVVGRQALILLGAPVQTRDIDLFLSPERVDLERLLACARALGLEDAGLALDDPPPFFKLYADNTHLDVFRARRYRIQDGEDLEFERMYRDRQSIRQGDVEVTIPSLADLIRTKRLRDPASPKTEGDATDLRYLCALRERWGGAEPSVSGPSET